MADEGIAMYMYCDCFASDCKSRPSSNRAFRMARAADELRGLLRARRTKKLVDRRIETTCR